MSLPTATSPRAAFDALHSSERSQGPVMCKVCGQVWSSPVQHYALGNVVCPGGEGTWRALSPDELLELESLAKRWTGKRCRPRDTELEDRRLRRKAARATEKARAEVPLLAAAGLVPEVTVEQVRQREARAARMAERSRARLEAFDEWYWERAAWCRAACAAHAPAMLATWDLKATRYPEEGPYMAEYWRERWEEVRGEPVDRERLRRAIKSRWGQPRCEVVHNSNVG